MIELANLKFSYKVLHNLLPSVTRKICMYDSSENTLSKQHNYNTRNKKTPTSPKMLLNNTKIVTCVKAHKAY